MAASASVEDLKKQDTLKEPKLVHKWFPAVCYKGKPVPGPMMIEIARSAW